MKYLIIKNKKIYKLFYKTEIKRLQYKSIFYNIRTPYYIRQYAFNQLKNLPLSSTYTMIRQRCFMTNNSRSILNHFKLSRIKLRQLVSNNFVNGVKKAN